MAIHQCAHFCNNPSLLHEHAVRHISRYIVITSTYVDFPDGNLWLTTHGIVYRPNIDKGVECCIYVNFDGGWAQEDVDNVENFMPRTGYVILHMGCPVLWCSKLQTEIDLSTTEAKYIALSQ